MLFLFSCLSLTAQENSAFSIKADKPELALLGSTIAQIGDLAWIEGRWTGEAFGGKIEEIWSAPDGESMMGMFRLISDGAISFYELMIIREVDKTLTLHLKHFHNTLKGWEEKDETVDFQLEKIEKDKVWFEGYSFEKTSDNVMTVNVLLDEEKPEGMNFIYHRQ